MQHAARECRAGWHAVTTEAHSMFYCHARVDSTYHDYYLRVPCVSRDHLGSFQKSLEYSGFEIAKKDKYAAVQTHFAAEASNFSVSSSDNRSRRR
jgi:S1-C subfamily serine protease